MAENNTVLRSGFNAKLRAEADAVLSDTVFRRSPVLSKLLRYLVEETAQGRADKLKSFIVATQGLGRPDNFDPASDSSARVQMVRLRKTLENHYAQHGPADDLCIYLQPGCYIVRLAKLSTAYPMLYRPLSDRQATPKSVFSASSTIRQLAKRSQSSTENPCRFPPFATLRQYVAPPVRALRSAARQTRNRNAKSA